MVFKFSDYLSDDYLLELGKSVGVDKSNSKITGAFIAKSFIQSALLGRSISLRAIEDLSHSQPDLNILLKSSCPSKRKIDHSSLGKSLDKISPEYFKKIYEDISSVASKKLCKHKYWQFHSFDSTYLRLSGRSIKGGLHAGRSHQGMYLKFTVGLQGNLPTSVRFCRTQSEVSEEVALRDAILEANPNSSVVLFDRGITSTSSYEDFDKQGIKFVTRVRLSRQGKIVHNNDFIEEKDAGVIINSDDTVHLYSRLKVHKNSQFRLIKATIKKTDSDIYFLTNMYDPTPYEIADMYRRRWDIEVFFKYIKQNLQIKHFIANSINGMMIYIYCMMIAAILLLLFQNEHNVVGFKRSLAKLSIILQKEIMNDIVSICINDPKMARYLQ